MLSSITMTFRILFFVFIVFALREQPMLANHWSRRRLFAVAMSPRRSPSPVLRFPEKQGWITSRVPGKDLTPCTPTLRRSGSTGTHTLLPAGGSIGRARHIVAAEFGGLVSAVALPDESIPCRAGCCHPIPRKMGLTEQPVSQGKRWKWH